MDGQHRYDAVAVSCSLQWSSHRKRNSRFRLLFNRWVVWGDCSSSRVSSASQNEPWSPSFRLILPFDVWSPL